MKKGGHNFHPSRVSERAKLEMKRGYDKLQKKKKDNFIPLDMTKQDWLTVPYNQIDHHHCWNQGKEPACGIPLKKHKICCLCAVEIPPTP